MSSLSANAPSGGAAPAGAGMVRQPPFAERLLFLMLPLTNLSNMHLNIEIKARCSAPDRIHAQLQAAGARCVGVDHQIDTYFEVPYGRLKLREGSIENHLIHYNRTDQAGPKASEVQLYAPSDRAALKATLQAALPVRVVVDKQRTIYYIDNVKLHVDDVAGLGTFVEIEAIDLDGSIGRPRLQEQCKYWMTALGIEAADLLSHSYSDMLRDLQR